MSLGLQLCSATGNSGALFVLHMNAPSNTATTESVVMQRGYFGDFPDLLAAQTAGPAKALLWAS